MSVTADEIKITERMLTQYFKDIKVLKIWKANIQSRREYKKRLEARIRDDIFVEFDYNIKSPVLSKAAPSNRQPPKGLDAYIDRASDVFDNLVIELKMVEIDIITTENEIERLEQRTVLLSEVVNLLKKEPRKIIEMRLYEDKTLEDIGDMINKSTSTVHEFYKKVITDICEWLIYVGAIKQ